MLEAMVLIAKALGRITADHETTKYFLWQRMVFGRFGVAQRCRNK